MDNLHYFKINGKWIAYQEEPKTSRGTSIRRVKKRCLVPERGSRLDVYYRRQWRQYFEWRLMQEMQPKGTEQALELATAETDDEMVALYEKYGFNDYEARHMVRGWSKAEATAEYGGIWRVGDVEFYQARNKAHAMKLYWWNFGEIVGVPVCKLKTDGQGMNCVIG